jgi:hypothetical protein
MFHKERQIDCQTARVKQVTIMLLDPWAGAGQYISLFNHCALFPTHANFTGSFKSSSAVRKGHALYKFMSMNMCWFSIESF